MKFYEHFNMSHLVHTVAALGIQWGLAATPWCDPISGGIAAALFFIATEKDQHDFKGGGPKNVSWYYGLVNHWNIDSVLDIVVPVVAMTVSFAGYSYLVGL